MSAVWQSLFNKSTFESSYSFSTWRSQVCLSSVWKTIYGYGDVLIHFFPLLFSVPHSFKTFAYLLYLYIWYFAQDYITLYIDGPVLGCEGDSDKCWSWHSSQIVRRLPLESRVKMALVTTRTGQLWHRCKTLLHNIQIKHRLKRLLLVESKGAW